MGQAGNVVITGRRDEDLSLMLQTPKRVAVDNTVSIPLEFESHGAGIFGLLSAA